MKLLTVEEHRELLEEAGCSDGWVIEERRKGWICALVENPLMPKGGVRDAGSMRIASKHQANRAEGKTTAKATAMIGSLRPLGYVPSLRQSGVRLAVQRFRHA
jgi:hypothetical protein